VYRCMFWKCFLCRKVKRMTITKRSKRNSFHIRITFRKVPVHPNWNVTKVCKKNWRSNPMRKMLKRSLRRGLKRGIFIDRDSKRK
jgi:hypothetical protein